jgi:hypothetical protein
MIDIAPQKQIMEDITSSSIILEPFHGIYPYEYNCIICYTITRLIIKRFWKGFKPIIYFVCNKTQCIDLALKHASKQQLESSLWLHNWRGYRVDIQIDKFIIISCPLIWHKSYVICNPLSETDYPHMNVTWMENDIMMEKKVSIKELIRLNSHLPNFKVDLPTGLNPIIAEKIEKKFNEYYIK